MKKLFIFFVSLLFTITIMNVNGQDICSRAAVIDSIFGSMSKGTTISINSSSIGWATFTANSYTNNLNIYRGDSNTVLIDTIYLYHGNCSALILDSIYNVNDTAYNIQFDSIVSGYQYYLLIKFNNSFSGSTSLSSIVYYKDCSNANGCGILKNENFNEILYGYYPYMGLNAFQNNSVCNWSRAFGEPYLPFVTPQSFFATRQWSNNTNLSQGIYQDINIPYVMCKDYTLSMKYFSTNNCNINVLLTNFNFSTYSGGAGYWGVIPNYGTSVTQNISSSFPTTGVPAPYSNHNLYEYCQEFSVAPNNSISNIVIYPTNGQLNVGDIQITPRITFNNANPLYTTCSGLNVGSSYTITANSPSGLPSGYYWIWSTVPNPSVSNLLITTWLSAGWGANSYTFNIDINRTIYVEAISSLPDAYGVYCRYYGSYTINVGNPSILPISISGSLNDNCHLHGIFSINNPKCGITYHWIVPISATVTPNNGYSYTGIGTTVTVDWGTTPANSIGVYGTDINGCIVYSDGVFIDPSILPPPTPTLITINGPAVLGCTMSGIYTFNMPTTPAPPTGTTWSWVLPGNATYNYLSNPTSITATWNNAGKGYIKLYGYDVSGCIIYYGELLVNPDPNCSNGVTYIASSLLNTNTASAFESTYFPGGDGTASWNPIFTSSTIYIDGLFTIDQSLYFSTCPNIIMGPNAKIEVSPNIELSVVYSHIYACSCAWDGIYVRDPSAIVDIEYSTIQDAKNAIVSINDGNFQVYNSDFVNNNIGIWVKDYNNEIPNNYGAHQGFISGSTFKYDATNIPVGPFSINNYITGIVVENVFGLTIGDNLYTINTNSFNNLQYGIKIHNSDVYIFNNNFDNIGIASANPPSYSGPPAQPNEAGIYCIKDPGLSYGTPPYLNFTNQILIGGGYGNIPNTFNDCNIGIYGKNINPDIENNTFNKQHYTGVQLTDCRDGATIEKNIFNMDPTLYATNNLYNSSIIVEFATTGLLKPLLVNGNVINVARTGIRLTSCVGGNPNTIDVNNNAINFNTVYSTYKYYGIISQSGDMENIVGNDIFYNVIPSSVGNIRGIFFKDVKNTIVKENHLKYNGVGILAGGLTVGTQFWCNYFDNSWEGIEFNSAAISDQVYPGYEATDNIWNDISSANAIYRVTGNIINPIPMINWYHEGDNWDITNTMSPYIYASNTLIGSIYPVDNQIEGCSNNKKSLQQQLDLSVLLKKIIMDSITYDTLQIENKYYAKMFAYKYLDDNPTYLNLGTPDDSIYQNFYNTTKQSNIGKLSNIDSYIKNRNYTNANTLNSSLTGINLPESNQIEVNRIYLGKLINDTISITDSASLVNIAYQEPSTGGKGVYGARVILGLDPYDNSLPQNFLPPSNNSNSDNTSDIKVYPNPANDKLFVDLGNNEDGTAKVEFYDLTGKLPKP